VALWPEPRRGPWIAGVVAALVAASGLVGLAALLFLVSPPTASQTYVEAIADEPPLLNPVLAPYTLAGQDVLPLIFSGLVRSDPSGGLSPDLAASWEVSPDGRAYTFRLREGLRWHDGRPLDAQDVAFTIGLVQAQDHQGSQELAELWRGVTVEVVDALTVRFSLPEALASFPEHLTLGLLPRHVLEGVAASELPLHHFNRQPVGSGAYRVTALAPERITLEPHGGYHGAPPRLTRVELRYFSDRGAAVAAVADGRVDGLGHLRADEVDRLTRSSGVVVYSAPERSKVATLSLNVQTPLFREKAIRRALGMAIDRDGLVTRALGGQAEPAFGPIPVQSWAYARVPGARELDPNGAAALLEQAGWVMGSGGVREREGQPLAFTLLTADTADRVAVARDLASQLARLGFRVQVRPLPADELTENHLESRQFEAALVGQWTIGSDPDVYPQWHSSQSTQLGGNYAGFSDPDIDRWLEVGRQQIGLEERRNAYEHFQARWAEELPSVVLYHPLYSFAVSRDIWGVRADPVPDSSWRLRDAVSWHRVARPSALQRARAAALALLPGAVRDPLS
jgi:peptide/nickel transport system substrate-binding protein